MAEEESHPRGPDFVECLREALSGQSQFSAENPGTGGEQHESARSRDAKDRRFLRLLHRRSGDREERAGPDRKSTRLNSSHQIISYAVFCLKKKKNTMQ